MAAFSLELAPWCRHSLLLKGEGAPRCSSGGCLCGLLTEILEGACLVRAAPQGITRLTVYRAHGTICALCRVSALLVLVRTVGLVLGDVDAGLPRISYLELRKTAKQVADCAHTIKVQAVLALKRLACSFAASLRRVSARPMHELL